MNLKSFLSLAAVGCLLAATSSSQAQIFAYDNLSTPATAGYSELNANNPVFGDQLTLSQGGTLSTIGASLYNSTSGGNTGSILTGSMLFSIYDNTVPYAGGAITGSLLGSATVAWDFTAGGGLLPGFYAVDTFNLTSLNITIPQNILITQRFTLTGGTSTRNGFVLFSNPTIGSSPANVYISSTATPAGLYTFSGNPGQVGYQIQLVPEPTTFALAGLGAASLLLFRRRR
jgi:hypothetical protein